MVKIAGAARVSATLRNRSDKATEFVQDVMVAEGKRIAEDAIHSIRENSSSSPHIPSLPGQAPNEEFGSLANNIEVLETGPLHVTISSNIEYAAHLEFGTSKMAPRPYMAPALQRNKKTVVNRIVSAVNQANRMK